MLHSDEARDGTTRAASAQLLLIVDDDTNVRAALRRLFAPQGYRVLLAEDGYVALGVLEKNPVDVVISDMRMPGMDGGQLLAEVTRRWPRVVKIMLTGYADLQATTQAIRNGHVDHFLTKPWEIDEIERCVGNGVRARDRRMPRKEGA